MRQRINSGIIGTEQVISIASGGGFNSIHDAYVKTRSNKWPSRAFQGGNQSAADVYVLAEKMVTAQNMATPVVGGSLTLNAVSLGNYEYVVKQGNQTISAFTATDWFSGTADTYASFCVVNGNLTINSGQTFIPQVRKLFTVLFVNGNLTVNGAISMTARGANHSGLGNSGGSTTAGAILIKTGTYSGITNPVIPAAGASGGAGSGGTGPAATGGGSGGGGGGGRSGRNGGAAGTSFSGGSGGGGDHDGGNSPAPTPNGGKGGDGSAVNGTTSNAGGAGNPGGTGIYAGAANGGDGTGGTLIVICTGTLSGAGAITSLGSAGGDGGSSNSYGVGGGGSGGGSVTVMFGTDTSTITPSAAGGSGGGGKSNSGGAGGSGTARKLSLA